MPNVQIFPLSACRLAPENARRASNGEVSGLASSIAAEGLLDPLHAYIDDGAAMIWDGGRRLRALNTLAKSKRLPSPLDLGIPVLVSDRQAARRRSLVTFVRENMHPAEELRAYQPLFAAGQDASQIAASLGIDSRRVAQILRLCSLAPEIIDAFEAGTFGLDAAQAFALTDDHCTQRAALAACGDWITAARVRQLLRTGTTSPRDRLARFVGRDAYISAGGRVLVDLFATDPDAEVWTDSGLVERLASDKLDEAVAVVSAEAWAWVTVVDPYDYSWGIGFQRLRGEMVELTAEDLTAYDEAVAILEEDGADPEVYDHAEAAIAAFDLKRERGEISAEQRGEAGVFIQVDAEGALSIKRGYRKETGGSSLSATKAAKTDDPALHGWGHTGHWHLTHVATAAVRHALLKDSAAAVDVLVASLAWDITSGRGGTCPALKLEPRGVNPVSVPTEARLPGEAAWEDRRQAWRERLPADSFEACFAFVVSLTPEEKAEIVALGVGLALDAVEPRFDQRRRGAWEQLCTFAGHVGLNITDAWTPDETFLARGSKAALLTALDETGGSDALLKAKKGEMVATLAKRVAPQCWTPKLLRELDNRAAANDAGAERD